MFSTKVLQNESFHGEKAVVAWMAVEERYPCGPDSSGCKVDRQVQLIMYIIPSGFYQACSLASYQLRVIGLLYTECFTRN